MAIILIFLVLISCANSSPVEDRLILAMRPLRVDETEPPDVRAMFAPDMGKQEFVDFVGRESLRGLSDEVLFPNRKLPKYLFLYGTECTAAIEPVIEQRLAESKTFLERLPHGAQVEFIAFATQYFEWKLRALPFPEACAFTKKLALTTQYPDPYLNFVIGWMFPYLRGEKGTPEDQRDAEELLIWISRHTRSLNMMTTVETLSRYVQDEEEKQRVLSAIGEWNQTKDGFCLPASKPVVFEGSDITTKSNAPEDRSTESNGISPSGNTTAVQDGRRGLFSVLGSMCLFFVVLVVFRRVRGKSK